MPTPCSQTQWGHPCFLQANIRDTRVCQLIKTIPVNIPSCNWIGSDFITQPAIQPLPVFPSLWTSGLTVGELLSFQEGFCYFYHWPCWACCSITKNLVWSLHFASQPTVSPIGQRISSICTRSHSSSSSFLNMDLKYVLFVPSWLVFCFLTGSWVSGFAVVHLMKLGCHFVSLIHEMAVS